VGTVNDGNTADGTPASAWQTAILRGMAHDAAGALYLADASRGKVYRIAGDGTINTFAGGGPYVTGVSGDGGPATATALKRDGLLTRDLRRIRYARLLRPIRPLDVHTSSRLVA